MKTPVRTLTALAAMLLIPLGAVAAEQVALVAPAETKTGKPAKKAEAQCEQSTASRIKKSKEDCGKASQPTTTYSKEDLERTGQTDTAEALRRLDPRFR